MLALTSLIKLIKRRIVQRFINLNCLTFKSTNQKRISYQVASGLEASESFLIPLRKSPDHQIDIRFLFFAGIRHNEPYFLLLHETSLFSEFNNFV